MRHRTITVAFAAAAGAAAIGAATATLITAGTDARIDKLYTALAGHMLDWPAEPAAAQPPALTLLKGGPAS